MFWGYFCAIVIIGFYINIPVYIAWNWFREETPKMWMYRTLGRFTYFSVLNRIGHIEQHRGHELPQTRAKLEQLYLLSKKRKVKFRVHRSSIERLLRRRVFGSSKVKVAWALMPIYTKVVVIWMICVYLCGIKFAAIQIADGDWELEWIASLKAALIVTPMWFVFCYYVFNYLVQSAESWSIAIRGTNAGFAETTILFWGLVNGYYWRDNIIEMTERGQYLSDYKTFETPWFGGEKKSEVNFDFNSYKGGSSKGSW